MNAQELLEETQKQYPHLRFEILHNQFVVQVLACKDCGKVIKTSRIDEFGNDICDECRTKRAEARRAKNAQQYGRDVARCEYHDRTDGCGVR